MLYRLSIALMLIALVGAASAAFPTFSEYVKIHGKDYNGLEYENRREMYNYAVSKLSVHDADWTVGVNKFTDMTAAEKSMFLGHQPSSVYRRNYAKRDANAPKQYKDAIDWVAAGATTATKDQGQCGSCWAFAATETIESYHYLAGNDMVALAPQQLVDCVQNPNECGGTGGCEGATCELAYGYVISAGGLASEADYPYKGADNTCQDNKIPFSANITSFTQLKTNDYDDLMTALQDGPVAVSVDAGSWFAYTGGVFDGCDQDTPDINHAVQAVGYGTASDGTDYWSIRNSWGGSWGESGIIRLKRNDPSATPCGTDVTPLDGDGCIGGPDSVEVCGTCGVLYDSAIPTI